MLPAEQRLRRSRDFAETVRGGRRGQRGCLVVHLLTGRPPGPAGPAGVRAGFVISRQVGGAVSRNRVRRRLRHLVRDLVAATPVLPAGTDLVVRVLPGGAARSFPQLSADLAAAFDAAWAPDRGPGRRTGRAGQPSLASRIREDR